MMDRNSFISKHSQLSQEMILSQKILGDHHPDTEISIKTMEKALSLCIRRAQRAANGHDHLDEAERLFSAIVSCQRPALGDMHPDTIKSVGALSHVLKKQHKLAEALPLYRQVAAWRSALGNHLRIGCWRTQRARWKWRHHGQHRCHPPLTCACQQ